MLRILKANGWYIVKQTGSHIHVKHANSADTLIVPYHASKDLGIGLANKLLKQAGLR